MAETDQPQSQQPPNQPTPNQPTQFEEDVSEMTVRPKQTVILLVVFALLLVVVWFAVSMLGSSGLSSAISEWEQAGNPTTVAQIEPAPLDPDQNAALLYTSAFARFPALGQRDWMALREPWRVKDVEALGRFVSIANEPLTLAHQAAKLEKARWPLDYTSAETLLDSAQRTVVPARNLAQLLAAEAVYKAETGDLEGAVESIDASLALGNHLLSDPMLVNLIVYLGELNPSANAAVPPGVEDVTLATFMVVFRDKQLPENNLRERLTAVDIRKLYPNVLAAEGAVAIENFTADDGVDRAVMSLQELGHEPPWWYAGGVAKLDMARYLRTLQADQKKLGAPLYQQDPASFEPLPTWAILSEKLLPSREASINLRITAAVGRKTMAHTALLLREYNAKNGSYPETLSDLSKAPVDPFTGRPLAYLKRTEEEGGGFIIGTAGRGEAMPMDWAWK